MLACNNPCNQMFPNLIFCHITIGPRHNAPSLPQSTKMSAPINALAALHGTEYFTITWEVSSQLEMDSKGDMKQA
jgi:hypothetical protein